MQAFAAAFDSWWVGPEAPAFPYAATLRAMRSTGKHFASESVTGRLSAIREARSRVAGCAADQVMLDAFLDTALDKAEGRYDYSTYCALKVMDLPEGAETTLSLLDIAHQRDVGLAGLLGDLVRFELSTLDGAETGMPLLRPQADQLVRRIARAMAALRPTLDRLAIPPHAQSADTSQRARTLLENLAPLVSDQDRRKLELSLQPVHTVHDEYMFLRILQAFEWNFAWIAVLLRGAILDMADAPEATLDRLRLANRILREAARLFPLIGTMQPEAFHDFRRFTEGASAIQSAGYKMVEALCRVPDPERLESVAYDSVPDVRQAVEAGQATLEGAYRAACDGGTIAPANRDAIAVEMTTFAAQLVRWRKAHYELARRFLGTHVGTGYTEGVPYLKEVRGIPVFRTIDPDTR